MGLFIGGNIEIFRRSPRFCFHFYFLITLVVGSIGFPLRGAYPTKKLEIAYVFFLYLGLYLLAAFLFHYLILALLGIMFT